VVVVVGASVVVVVVVLVVDVVEVDDVAAVDARVDDVAAGSIGSSSIASVTGTSESAPLDDSESPKHALVTKVSPTASETTGRARRRRLRVQETGNIRRERYWLGYSQ